VHPPRPEDFSTIILKDGSWYAYEEVGRSPKRRVKAWFHYWTETITSTRRRDLNAAQAEAYRLEGKLKVEEDETGPFIWEIVSREKSHKRTANRADILWISNYISEKLSSQ
jgi:hypothetical protein